MVDISPASYNYQTLYFLKACSMHIYLIHISVNNSLTKRTFLAKYYCGLWNIIVVSYSNLFFLDVIRYAVELETNDDYKDAYGDPTSQEFGELALKVEENVRV